MPLYEYECLSCDKRSEVIQSFNDPPLNECPLCGGEVRKLLSAPAFQFKGTGWYVTDYASKKGSGGDQASKESSDKDGKVDAEAGSGKSDEGDKTKDKKSASSSD